LLGLAVSFLSGLLGIGGGIVMAPALLFIPAWLGVGTFNMQAVTGLTITQGLFASLSGALRHGKNRFVDRSLVLAMGPAMAASTLVGAVTSKYVAEEWLRGLFALMAVVAAALMFLPSPQEEAPAAEDVPFSRPLAAAVALILGFLVGLIGQGGSFILIPLMIHLLRVPTRIALGSNLGIVFCAALAGLVGKWSTGQIPLWPALALVLGALPGAQLGGMVSRRVRPRWLRGLLAGIILAAAVKMVASL
jgi:uncharacterized membrane protein YfcA